MVAKTLEDLADLEADVQEAFAAPPAAAPARQNEPGIEFWGNSFVAGPQGEMLAEAPAEGGSVLIAEIEQSRSEVVRRAWPFLRDRRPEIYEGLFDDLESGT